MLTSDTIKEYFDSLTEKQINEVFNDNDNQYFGIGFHTFNVGGFSFVVGFNNYPNEEQEDEILSTGGCIVDSDQFLQLFKESKSINPFLIELL